MSAVHIVAFKIPDAQNLSSLTAAMRELGGTCVRRDGSKYIKSLKGGKQISPEGKDHGMNVVFVLEMEAKEDLDYYLFECPAHAAFKKRVPSEFKPGGPPVCLDFMNGDFP